MHVEFLRGLDGLITCSALQLVRFTTEERLAEIIRLHREHGVRINNPHVFVVEDGKAGGTLPPEIVAMKHRFDPRGLLNPGKLRDWPVKAAVQAGRRRRTIVAATTASAKPHSGQSPRRDTHTAIRRAPARGPRPRPSARRA